MHGFCSEINMRYFFILLLACSSMSLKGQFGAVEIISDPDIDALEQNRISKRQLSDGKVHGYRIMIAFYADRAEANQKLEEVRGYFASSYGATLLYDEPNFKIYAGEFVTKADAELALTDIRKRYPGARIVNDLVRPPRVH